MTTETENAAVFRLKNVFKKREKGGNVFEMRVDDVVIRAGEFIAIVGESGCGKSTLLDMLGLALKPTGASRFTIRPTGEDKEHEVMDLSESRLAEIRKIHVGYVLQTGGLLPFLSVRENIFLPREINGLKGVDSHVDVLVKRLRIENQMNKKPQFLSGGQRQRVAIARALAHRPPIVLADEPTAAVDKLTARDIMAEFDTLTREMGVTLLMVTHDLALVADVADRVLTFEVDKRDDQHTRSRCVEKDRSALSAAVGRTA